MHSVITVCGNDIVCSEYRCKGAATLTEDFKKQAKGAPCTIDLAFDEKTVLEQEDELYDELANVDDALVDELLENEDELYESLLEDDDTLVEAMLEETSPLVDPTIATDVALVENLLDEITREVSP